MKTSFLLGQFFGVIALIILVISLQKNKKEELLRLQVLSSLFFALQYFFLKAFTGSLMNIVTLIRNIIFNKSKSILSLIVIISIMIILTIYSYENIYSILPSLAVIFFSIAVFQDNIKIIRYIEVLSCLLFIIYNIKYKALFGFISTLIELTSVIIAITRNFTKSKQTN